MLLNILQCPGLLPTVASSRCKTSQGQSQGLTNLTRNDATSASSLWSLYHTAKRMTRREKGLNDCSTSCGVLCCWRANRRGEEESPLPYLIRSGKWWGKVERWVEGGLRVAPCKSLIFHFQRSQGICTKTQMNCDSSLCLACEDTCRVSRAPWWSHHPTPAVNNYLVQNVSSSLCSRVVLFSRYIMPDLNVIKIFLIATLKRNRWY